MKKALHKILHRSSKPPETGGRITNETVAEHRERVLAGGRKFKYPLQYTKRRVLLISVAIVALALIGFVIFLGWQLYGAQSTDRFTYRVTQVVPVPVARVDGEWVRYSDYLSDVRSAIHYLATKEAVVFNSNDGKRQLEFQKRLALNRAIQNAYVAKIAREQNITVNSSEVDAFVGQQIGSNRLGVSESVYRQIIADYYDWSFEEYKKSVSQQLLRKKVSAHSDTTSKQAAENLRQQIAKGADFSDTAKKYSEDVITKARGGDVGLVSKDSEDPSGLIAVANQLKIDAISDVVAGVDGFYIIKLLEKRDNGDVRFAKIFISYKYLNEKMAELRSANLIDEYIRVEEVTQPTNQ